jgi:cytoskeletal protein CcmA (bactofilin family)
MFGRKKPETPQSESASAELDLPPLKLRSGATAPAQPSIPPVPTTLVAPVQPKFDIPKRSSDVTGAAATPRPVPPTPAPPVSSAPSPASEGKRLLVGRDIMLSGEINTCDQLVVEGRVEATLSDTRAIEIRESGYFKGNAEIDDAVINGVFEGNLTVRNRLLIHATGKISGKIRYGMLEVECGGQLSGDVQMVGEETKRSGAAASTGGSSLGLGNGAMSHNNQAEGWRAET